jgi:hypothetical protein
MAPWLPYGLTQAENLDLPRCPHCGIARPNLKHRTSIETWPQSGEPRSRWVIYACETCGGVVVAASYGDDRSARVYYIFPPPPELDEAIPEPARECLRQARESVHAPIEAVVLAAHAVDEMLGERGVHGNSLNEKIERAAADHLITKEMATWAHEVRLDANAERHPKKGAPLPTEEDARRVIAFAEALAQYLFELPALVRHGREDSKPSTPAPGPDTPKAEVETGSER